MILLNQKRNFSKINERFNKHRSRYKEKRANFYRHINWMPEHRLTKRLMDWVKTVKATTNLKINAQKELKNARITDTDIKDRDVVRRKIRESEDTLEEQRKRP